VRVALNDAIWVLPGSQAWLGRTLVEHEAIVDALARGNAAAGRRAALAHLTHTDHSVRALLASL
jgi:DNA-binding FadR family transcriptional regulator